jgi:hypothetical protein
MIASPRTTQRLLEALGADASFRDDVLGDLAEEFAIRVEQSGANAASSWYRREAVRAAPHLLRDWSRHMRPRDVAHLVGVLLTSYVFVLMTGFFLAATVRSVLLALGVSVDVQLRPSSAFLPALALSLGMAGPILAGYIAAWLYSRAPLVGAVCSGCRLVGGHARGANNGTQRPRLVSRCRPGGHARRNECGWSSARRASTRRGACRYSPQPIDTALGSRLSVPPRAESRSTAMRRAAQVHRHAG